MSATRVSGHQHLRPVTQTEAIEHAGCADGKHRRRIRSRTARLLEDLGFTPIVADISEFEKLEGCVTCLNVLLPGR